ncbi:hypothetical protein Syun_017188 [Stephania yunnanensis]|uniref:Uncharacterized protein n=1 Tax=Stephania yunnanensis TaxID=152371 RepID=A0AAP0J6G8_9MAGN
MQTADDTRNSVKEEPRATSGCGGVGPSSGGGPNQPSGGRLRETSGRRAGRGRAARRRGSTSARKGSSNSGAGSKQRRLVHVEATNDGAATTSLGLADPDVTWSGEFGEGGSDGGGSREGGSVSDEQRDGGGAVDRAGVLERDDGAAMTHGLSGDGGGDDDDNDGGGGGSPATVRREMVLQGVTIEMGLQGGGGEKMVC